MSEKKNVIIIGAGPAGLTAAYELLKHTDYKPVILEESDVSYTVTAGETEYRFCKQCGLLSSVTDNECATILRTFLLCYYYIAAAAAGDGHGFTTAVIIIRIVGTPTVP